MGLFDGFRKRLKEVEEKAAEEVLKGQPPEPKPAPVKARPVQAKPKTPAAPVKPAPRAGAPLAKPAPAAVTPASAPQPTPEQPQKKLKIEPDRVREILWDLELMLLESDVALPVAEEVLKLVEGRLLETRVATRDDVVRAIDDALKDALREILGKGFDFDAWLLECKTKPVIIMFVGVNGTGKTTTIARITHRLQGLGFQPVLAAGDTFRAGAIEQLERWGEKLGVRVIKHGPGSDPAAVAYDALEHAKARLKDVVLLDTAGRMQTNINLMDELRKIARVAKPHLTIYVGDALAGNDAIQQAREFDAAVGVDAVVLTKVDTDAKGGAALSIARAVGKPIVFLGVGQNMDDLVPFNREWLIQRIFGEA